ncbi:PH domain-containing protein [Radiobacillus sp. PE A8.2]|uniref:PH domain-containing protein n=1 Tax=Radiobacillus sp. PE A8.2 TaxID=3380349 RepID=UPI00388E2811
MKRYIKTFKQNKLANGENLLDVAAPEDKPTELMFVTDRRVFYFKMNTKDTAVDKIFEHTAITNCELSSDATISQININTASESMSISKVPNQIAEKIKETIDGFKSVN